jgi:hypothetical protein
VRQNPHRHSGKLLLLHRRTKHRRVELERPIQIQNRNVTPNNLIGHSELLIL